MRSETRVESPDLIEHEIDPSPDDLDGLINNCPAVIKRGIIEVEKPMVNKQVDVIVEEDRRSLVDQVKEKLSFIKDDMTVDDIKDILKIITA